MSATSEEQQQQAKKVTADKVQTALYEKDELFKEGVQYEDAFVNQNGSSGSRFIQPRKLGNSNNQIDNGNG